VYFSVYTLAMQTGRTRSAQEISDLLVLAGFDTPVSLPGFRSFVTSSVVARRK
jgi:demethylspheroidene O-methyltransferase